MTRPESSPMPSGKGKRARHAGVVTTGVLGVAGLVSCLTGSCSENGDQIEPSPSPPGITTPGESTNPFVSPPPSLSPVSVSLCNTQRGTQEGQLPGGTPLLSATTLRPSVFVVSPDRSSQQAFRVKSEEAIQSEWYTITHTPSVGIVGLATADVVFDSTKGRTVWARTCEPTPAAGRDEVESRVRDLCKRRELGITEVVVYQVGRDGKPKLAKTQKC